MPLHERDAAVGVRYAPRMYPPELQPMIQDTLHTLANIDFEHETDVTRLIESSMSPALKASVMQKLVARHRERREPYVQLLTSLRMQVAQVTRSMASEAA
jgi:hypothetical protein